MLLKLLPIGTKRRSSAKSAYILCRKYFINPLFICKKLKNNIFRNKKFIKNIESNIYCSLDSINDYWFVNINKEINVLIDSKIYISGWAVIPPDFDIAGLVYVKIDNKYFKAKYKIKRLDVEKAFNITKYRYCGFICKIKAKDIGLGENKIKLVLINRKYTNTYEIETGRKIYISEQALDGYQNVSLYKYGFNNFIKYLEKQEYFLLLLSILSILELIMKILDKYFKMRKNNQLSHKIFKTSNYKKYALENKLIFVTKQCSKNTLVYNPVYVRNGNIKQMQTVQQPEIYISELNDVTVFSECSAVLTQDNKVLFDMAFHPEAKRYNFKDNFLRYADKSNSILYLNKDNRIVIDECIMLCGTASRNYYHWLFEFLTRLSLIEGEIRYNKFPLLIDEAVLEISQMAEVLRLFSDGHRFIILPQNSRCHVKKLIVPSYLVWMPINLRKNEKIKSTDSVISIEAVNFLRNKISSVLQNEEFKYRGRKFYISRKTCKTGYRKLLNEDKVIEVFVKHGFDIIYPETMTFTEQYRIFSTAASIAGATGAGLTNIVFAPRECIIFCLINKPIDFSVYSTIAGIIGQTMLFIDGERESCFNTTDLEYQSDFKINVKDLDRVLIKEMKTVNGVEN